MKQKRNVQTSLVFVFSLVIGFLLLLQTRSFITSYIHEKLDDQTVLDASSGGYFGGLGTKDNPYIVSKADDMVYLSQSVNAGETYKDKHFSVVASIGTITLKNFTPIGTSAKPFEGHFDGSGITIDLNILNETLDNQGLFGYIKGSIISNISIKGNVTGKNYVGAIVGYMNGGTISNIYNKTSVIGSTYIGGLVGYKLSGTIQNVYNQASIKGVSEVGGIVGRNQGGNIQTSYNHAKIEASSSYAGGITGYLYTGTIRNTYNRGEILSPNYAGGIAGGSMASTRSGSSTYHTNAILSSYNSGLISANSYANGIIGFDNPSNYSGSSNQRNQVYYDTSVLVEYDQPYNQKPSVLPSAQAKTSDFMLYSQAENFGYNATIWYFESSTGTTAYYPQLRVFSFNPSSVIKKDSLTSVSIDVSKGLGTKDIPFLIKSAEDMHELSRMVQEGNTYLGYYFKVDEGITELDLGNFKPIGTTSKYFQGNFNGNGVNFKVEIDTQISNVGIFGAINNGAVIENFSVSGSIKGADNVGSVLGYLNNGTVRNVYSTAKVEGNNNIGGLIGYLYIGSLSNGFNLGEVKGAQYVGGIVGQTMRYNRSGSNTYHSNTISNVYSAGKVSVVSGRTVGGAIGYDNLSNYSGSGNLRSNIYYDITVIANFDQGSGYIKPSSLASSLYALNSGQLFTQMTGKLGSGWYEKTKDETYAYYPQLTIFSNHDLSSVKNRSELAVKVDISLGMGTEELPFMIRNKADIDELRQKVKDGNTFEGFHFKVDPKVSEFDLGEYEAIGSLAKPFYGSFDGSHASFNLLIENNQSYQGLFGYFGIGTIKNLSIKGSIKGASYVGSVVGYKLSGTIQNVYNQASIKGVSEVGGIVGRNQAGNIQTSYNHAKIEASSSYAGGITGYLYTGTIRNTYNRGEILSPNYAGGIAGGSMASTRSGSNTYHTNAILSSYNSGLISANSYANGIIGYDNPSNYSGSSNQRNHVYYDVSILIEYKAPYAQKPSTKVGGQGLEKTSMFNDQMSKRGFSLSQWTYKPIDGNYAYYPQLKVFSENTYQNVKDDSTQSVITNPFLGNGTQASPYIINTAEDMEILAKSIGPDYDAEGIYYIVSSTVGHIDLTTVDYQPIGNQTYPFKGHFDGNHANFNLSITGQDYLGLFGYVGISATVKNVSVTGEITGRNNIGAIAGRNDGIITNVYSSANIKGNNNTGGLIGLNNGEITLMYHTGNITSTGIASGGLIGYNTGIAIEGYFGGKIQGNAMVGALIGFNNSTNIGTLYYNSTIISYDDILENHIKPTQAVGNQTTLEDAPLEKEDITGIDIFSNGLIGLNQEHWVLKATNGFYDYYPQLKGFSTHIHSVIKTNSENSSRIIRFKYGTGAKNNPYLITNEEDMKALSDITQTNNLLGIYFKVIDGVKQLDLTLETLNFKPIGSSVTSSFRGGFDGNDVTIILSLNTPTLDYVGLFGHLGAEADIKNIHLKGSVIGKDRTGALAGHANGATISNISNHATINGRQYTGGLIGYMQNTQLTTSYNMADVNATSRDIGGIVGFGEKSVINNVFNHGNITGTQVIAGIIGYANNHMTLSNVYNSGNITATVLSGNSWIGGIIGASYTNTTLSNSYSAGVILARTNSYIGGIIGGVSGITYEENSYYDRSIIDAEILKTGYKAPTSAIGNKLDSENVRKLYKNELTGLNASVNTKLNPEQWVFLETQEIETYYPQLKVFTQHYNDYVKADSLTSVTSFVFVGQGTQTNPYIIVNKDDMDHLSSLVQKGISFSNTHFKVKEDISSIDLTYGKPYISIGDENHPFEGIFDGTGTNFILNINTQLDYQGLFGNIGVSGVVKNLSTSGNITAKNHIGSIAGINHGTIQNVYSTTHINGTNILGGLIGENHGSISSSYFVGTIKGSNHIGGLIGINSGTIKDAYTSSEVFGENNIGGIIGYSSGDEENIYYNESKIDVSTHDTLKKPYRAISNKQSTSNITGMTSNKLYSRQDLFSENTWYYEPSTGFYAYYPQLETFSKNPYSSIKERSRDSVTVSKFNQGDGSKENPYIIRNEHDMEALSQMTKARYTLLGIYFEVAKDVLLIDLNQLETPYTPIGNNTYRFEGNFNGNGIVFNLDLDKNENYQGIFGVIGVKGHISNIGVKGSITASRFTGGIAGRNYGTIENSYNMANITGLDYVGGITGYSDGNIYNTFNTGNITANDRYAGGITGGLVRNKEITYSYNTGNITSLGKNNSWTETGGIAGYLAGNLSNTYSYGQVLGKNYLGGIAGRVESFSNIESSYNIIEPNLYITSNPNGLNKATQALGNLTKEEAQNLYKNQMTGDLSFGHTLDLNRYILKQSNELTAYLPQLDTFTHHEKQSVKNDSLASVTNPLLFGKGTQLEPYMIHSAYDLRALGIVVTQGLDTENMYFKVYDKAVIDFALIQKVYVPIGTPSHPFKGSFDGNNQTIKIAIETQKDYAGLFGYTSMTSELKNIHINGKVIASNYAGLLVGYNQGRISNIIINGNLQANDYAGLLAGYSENHHQDISVNGSIKANNYVGGVIGYANNATILKTYFIGDINANNYAAGFIGKAGENTEITFSFAHGSIIGNDYISGFIAENYATITNSYATIDVLGNDYISGFVSKNYGDIHHIFTSGSINGNHYVAGVASENNGTIDKAYYNHTLAVKNKQLTTPKTAIYNIEDSLNIGSRTLDEMTAKFPFGNDESQMDLEESNYYLRENYDFTQYLPELMIFKNHTQDIFTQDSLKSITYQKVKGLGTKANPYLIYDGYDMNEIAYHVGLGNDFTGKYFKVAPKISTIDLSLKELSYQAIGSREIFFNGNFDGNNAIFILNIQKEEQDNQGIFNTLGTNALVENIIINGQVTGLSYVGSITGRNLGTIRNIQNYAQIRGLHNDVGGIVGYNEGFITNVFNYGQITASGSFVGGIAGQSYQHIKEAYNKASVTGYVNVGGIVGNNHALIEYAYNTSQITATKNISGGITGTSYGNISYSFNSGDITSEDSVAGGITGVLNQATIKGTYNAGTILAKSSQAAGIVANIEKGIIKDSYHFGKVYAHHDLGIIIGNQIDDNQQVLQNVYYDQDAHINSDTTQYKIPTHVIGNKTYTSNSNALYHGQMIGMNALGTTKNHMNLSEKANYLQKESEEQYSYYPQLSFFGKNNNTVILNDSKESVKTKTFIVGTGTQSNPYIIRNESDWQALADSTTNGNTYTNIFFEVSKEKDELNFMDAEENYIFKPVGTKDKPFNGTLNGNGVNIKIKTTQAIDYQALFGHLGKQAHIKALSVSGVITGKDYTAAIASINEGLIEEVYNQAQITGKDYTAGLVSLNKGTIQNVYNKGKITGNQYVGGITAHLDGTLINSYQSGIVYGQKTLGMIVGFYEKGTFSNSYYDETILNAYRAVSPHIKPEGSVGSTYNGDLVKGLDNRFMTGSNALGTGNFNINFKDGKDIWSVSRNIESNNHYPQLLVFATSTHENVKKASQQSTLNHLYTISFDEKNNENNDSISKQVLINEHFSLYIPTHFGYNFVGWYYLDGETEVQLTNAKGESLKPYNIYENLEVFAKWEEAYHQVTFIDGDDKVIYETEIRHGEYVSIPVGITPSKTKDQLYIYQFESWYFDFDHTMILSPTKIYATYKKIDRYYEVIYYDGNNQIFEIAKVEYETYLQPTQKIPTKTYHDDIAYQFIEWDFNFNEVIKNKVEIHPIFIEVDRYYTVEFYNGDQLFYTTTTEYLNQATTPEDTPIKISDEKYNYQFIGWDKNIDYIKEDLKVYAVFKEELKEFIVNFKDGNDKIFNTQKVKYGQSASNPLGLPTKTPFLNTAYQFIGWDQSFDEVKTDLTINAVFKEVDRYYTVNFYDDLGNLLDSQIVEYLNSATKPLITPTKEETQSHVYTFEKWDQDLERITENLEVRPIFKEELRPYQVYFIDGNNNIFNQQTVLYKENATIPSGIPRKQGVLDIGFKFISWQDNYKEITNDTYVYANFSETNRYYYVTFMDQDLVLKTEKVEYGYSATAPDLNFEEHPVIGYEYYFIAWDKDFSFVETDLTINLNKGSRLKKFEVTIINGDDITTQTVEYGKNAILPIPSKKGNEQIHYQFISWSHDGKNIKENITITASFEEVYNYFEVRFYDGNNTLIKLEKVAPGMHATAPITALKDKTETKIYLFLNWDKDFSSVESNLNVYAKFKEVDRYYEVIFYDAYGKEISIQSVEYGQSAIEPLAPEKQEEGRYEYHFTNWDKDFSTVIENMMIYPEYDQIEKTFTVNFYDGNQQLISSQQIKYGLNAIAPKNAEKRPTETKYYLFIKWDKNYTNITEDLEIYAEFNEVDRWYQVTFIGKNQQILHQQIIEYGKSAKDPIPILGLKVTTIIDDYTILVIDEWDQDFSYITENLEINAIYKVVDRYYQVTFYDDQNNILEDMRIHYGTNVIPPTPPIKAGDTNYFYVFKAWDQDFSFITENLEIYPIYDKLKTKYQVTFYDASNNTFDVQEIEYGKDAIDPGIPLKSPTDEESYIFTGWDQEFKNITEDLEIYPTYSTHERTFVVIFKDDQGNTLKEELVKKGGQASPPTNIKEKPQTDYFKYIPTWDQDYKNITEDKVITLYYEEVERIYTASFYDDNHQLIHTITGTYLSYIDAPEGPIKAMTDQYIYQFISWNPVFNNQLTKDISYYPVYERTIRTYVVTFLDGNQEIYDVQEIAYGQSPQKPLGTPTKQADKQYYYEFRMWETTTIKVYQDLTIHAIFYRYLQKYQVTFVDEYDNVLSSQTVEYGNGATEPDASKIPNKPPTHEYVYVFSGWDKSFSFITEDITVKTVYIGTLRKYVYTFYDEDEITILKQIIGSYGDRIIPPDDPTKPPTDMTTFQFIGWDKPVSDTLTEDVIYIARYKENLKNFSVIFIDGDDVLFNRQTVSYGHPAQMPNGIPSKSPTTMYQYVFTHWDTDYSNVTSDLIIRAVFERKLREYKVTFIIDKEVIEEYVEYGSSAYGLLATPEKKGYRFVDWDKNLSVITSDLETKAIFKANSYNINFYNGYEDGDLIEVEGIMNKLIKEYDSTITLPKVTYTKKGYYFVGWKKAGYDYVSYLDQHTFKLTETGLDLHAVWLPVHYQIKYELDGGTAINPTSYTIEDHIILQSAHKTDHRFVGWYLTEHIVEPIMQRQMMSLNSIEQEGQLIEELLPGTIGNITLTARYEYDGYIQIKDEFKDVLGLYYADITSTIPIEEREKYDDENPVYLIGWGVKLGQTLKELRNMFVNDDLIFIDSKEKPIDDNQVVATSYQIILKGEDGLIKDRVHIVLYGDTNGDGQINVRDTNAIRDYINRKNLNIEMSKILSLDVNNDGQVNVRDTNDIRDFVNKKKDFWA